MASGFDIYMVYRFVKDLSTPFDQTDAFRLGLVDKNGKKLRKAKTSEEKSAVGYYTRLIFNLKRILVKFGMKSAASNFAAALLLLKEENVDPDISYEELCDLLRESLAMYKDPEILEQLNEEIANSIGASAAPSTSPAGNVAIWDPILGQKRRRGRPPAVGKPIDGISSLKRAARKVVGEEFKSIRQMRAERDDHVKSMKWKKFQAVDSDGFKIHGQWHHKSGDGRYELRQTGEHPTRGFAHTSKKTYWSVHDTRGKPWQGSYENLKKAKEAVSDHVMRTKNENI